jgi:hypothetical protein
MGKRVSPSYIPELMSSSDLALVGMTFPTQTLNPTHHGLTVNNLAPEHRVSVSEYCFQVPSKDRIIVFIITAAELAIWY